MQSLLSAATLTIETENGVIHPRKTGEARWEADGFVLEIETSAIDDGYRLSPTLRYAGNAPTFVEKVELFRAVVPGGADTRYLRFGLNMPGDAVYFGVLGQRPERIARNFDHLKDLPVVANTLLAFLSKGRVTVIGAGSFRLAEGTPSLDLKDGRAVAAYAAILDGVRFAPGEERRLDDMLILFGDDLNAVLARWADLNAAARGARVPKTIPTGWNDWQFYREEKTQRDVLDSAEIVAELKKRGCPLDFVQIDGGFCLYLAEWSEPGPGFPDGIAALSRKIRDMGLKFGLWLAPYIQNVNTTVVKDHPDWLYLDRQGAPVNFPKSNVGASVLIDYSIPAALEWLRDLVRFFVEEWHVEWIKLDGPDYSKYRLGRPRDRSKTVSEMLNDSFRVIRETAGDNVLVEGEGMMGLALGNVDLHRVQTDNHPKWYIEQLKSSEYAPRVYGKELVMGFLHNRWWSNHRENVVLRNFFSPFHAGNKEKLEQLFTDAELHTQLVAAIMGSGGLLLTDPLKELARVEERFALISKIFPVYPKAAEIVDTFPTNWHYPAAYRLPIRTGFEEYVLFAVINWSDEVKDFRFDLKTIVPGYRDGDAYDAFSWFERKPLGQFVGALEIKGVAPHDARLLALRKVTDVPRLISTSTHMTQGAVDLSGLAWDEKTSTLSVRVCHYRQEDETLFFAAPKGWAIQRVETDARRHSIDLFEPRYPSVRFQGAADGDTFFEVRWKKSGKS